MHRLGLSTWNKYLSRHRGGEEDKNYWQKLQRGHWGKISRRGNISHVQLRLIPWQKNHKPSEASEDMTCTLKQAERSQVSQHGDL